MPTLMTTPVLNRPYCLGSTGPYLNNFNLGAFSTVWWLDAVNGNDLNLGTVEHAPLQTWQHAYTVSSDGDCFVFKPGTYPVANAVASYTSSCMQTKNNQTFIAQVPGQVILWNQEDIVRRDEPMLWGHYNSEFYGFVFHHRAVGNSNYETAFFKRASHNVYNCVITHHPDSPERSMSLMYDNYEVANTNVYNCTFVVDQWRDSYSSVYRIHSHACATTLEFREHDEVTPALENATITPAPEYCCGHPDYGVYAGTYAWPLYVG